MRLEPEFGTTPAASARIQVDPDFAVRPLTVSQTPRAGSSPGREWTLAVGLQYEPAEQLAKRWPGK